MDDRQHDIFSVKAGRATSCSWLELSLLVVYDMCALDILLLSYVLALTFCLAAAFLRLLLLHFLGT
jgi:hypothetical protein